MEEQDVENLINKHQQIVEDQDLKDQPSSQVNLVDQTVSENNVMTLTDQHQLEITLSKYFKDPSQLSHIRNLLQFKMPLDLKPHAESHQDN